MPIYEYRCDECSHQFDVFQKITDDPVSECPECGGPVHKLVSQTSFVLKGGGWYATEYGNRRPPKGENKEGTKTESKKSGAKKGSKAAAA
jgi:putative FmdB family regulatory protein